MSNDARVDLWYVRWCGFCRAAKRTLEKNSIPYRMHDLTGDSEETRALKARTGHPTMPQVFIDGELLGGFDELSNYIRKNGVSGLSPKN